MEEQYHIEEQQQTREIPELLKILTVLTYVFSSLMILIMIIILFAMGYFLELFTQMGLFDEIESLGGNVKGVVVAIFAIVIIFFIVFEVITMIGAYQMRKGKKLGFWFWIIPNAFYLLLSIGGSITGGYLFVILVTIAMMVGYISQYKYLN